MVNMGYAVKLDPRTNSTVNIKLYKNVRNIEELRTKLIDGSIKCCIVRAGVIADPFVVVMAANKAVTAEKTVTKTVYTEILYNLSISTNITQSLKQFGISEGVTDVLVVTLNDDDPFESIEGDEVDIDVLQEIRNIKDIQKLYKLQDSELKDNLMQAVCNKIAIKGL